MKKLFLTLILCLSLATPTTKCADSYGPGQIICWLLGKGDNCIEVANGLSAFAGVLVCTALFVRYKLLSKKEKTAETKKS